MAQVQSCRKWPARLTALDDSIALSGANIGSGAASVAVLGVPH
jgi:hypothetical protein